MAQFVTKDFDTFACAAPSSAFRMHKPKYPLTRADLKRMRTKLRVEVSGRSLIRIVYFTEIESLFLVETYKYDGTMLWVDKLLDSYYVYKDKTYRDIDELLDRINMEVS
jgi:hypothetical protein